ncbi:hypothetical protein GCM10010250_41240 [Streptomyces althioticus]|nr:hypothetical protein GCM10010250_41240 [Streptomyces althioticus]GGT42904.1 hypothetical protein GCM10010243_19980 [Streptomyces matensis]
MEEKGSVRSREHAKQGPSAPPADGVRPRGRPRRLVSAERRDTSDGYRAAGRCSSPGAGCAWLVAQFPAPLSRCAGKGSCASRQAYPHPLRGSRFQIRGTAPPDSGYQDRCGSSGRPGVAEGNA